MYLNYEFTGHNHESTGHYSQIWVSNIKNNIKTTYNKEKQEERTLTWKKRGTNNNDESNQ